MKTQALTSRLKEFCRPASSLDWWYSWFTILFGCFLLATGFVLFINPYNIVPGGVYGISIVLHYLVPGIQVGTFDLMIDIPLMLLSFVFLGSKLGMRTIVAAVFTPLVMNGLTLLAYPTREAMEQLDPAQLLGGCLNLSDHLLLSSVIGSLLLGIGAGLVVRNQGTTGGSDIIAMFMQKYLRIRFSYGVLIVDFCVVLAGMLVIGFGLGGDNTAIMSESPLYLSLYSLICIYLYAKVISLVINGRKDDKLVFVISDKDLSEFHRFILDDLSRSATLIKSSGLYSGQDKEMLFLMVSYKEVAQVKVMIKQVDPNAFVVVTDAYDTFGEGWKSLPNAGETQAE